MKRAAAVLVVGLGVGATSIMLTPASHDFGKMIVNTGTGHHFQLTGMSKTSIIRVTITGPDAGDFLVDSTRAGIGATGAQTAAAIAAGKPILPVLQSSCLGMVSGPGSSCDYHVLFHPRSVGKKSAQLIVIDNGYVPGTATAALTGEGIFSCRPHLVSCNWADFYSGLITIHSVDSTATGAKDRIGRWETKVDITIDKGLAWCHGVQNDKEEEYTLDNTIATARPTPGGSGAATTLYAPARLDRRSIVKGVIDGPGLFAVEFRGAGASMEYVLSFDCPTATVTSNTDEYVYSDKVIVNSSTGKVPSDSAQWRHKSLVGDPQPATKPGMDLIGTQSDPHPDNGFGVQGYSAMVWSLKRW